MLIFCAHDEGLLKEGPETGVYSCYGYLVMPVGASDFPHSRQEVLDREVINPQKGHILCDAKPRAFGVSGANSVETEAEMEASRLRKRSRNRRKSGSINDPPSFFPPNVRMVPALRPLAETLLQKCS